MKKHIPNTITSLNIFAGSLATLFAIDGHLVWAGIFICLAAVFDFLDGLAARMLNAYSEIGKQLDSLADVVSFGVAPGAILFTLLEFSLFEVNQPIYEISADWKQWAILFSALLIPVFGALRLARFNAEQSDEPFFRGLPIPANGIFWASMGLMLEFPQYQEYMKHIYSTKTLVLLGLFMSGMMVLSIPMFSFKIKTLSFGVNWHRYLFLALSLALIIPLKIYAVPVLIFLYILMNTVLYLLKVEV